MATALATLQRPSLSASFANKYGIDQAKVFAILRDTALKSKDPVSDAEVAAFMIVCNQYDLNPFIKEIYGFISKGKMQYVVSVDGWATLINRHQQLNGIEFDFDYKGEILFSVTCKIHRKDRSLPTVIPEFMSECIRDTDPWKQWPKRMLRHKAMIQCSRIAFGLGGILDEDEAERMPGYVPPIIEASIATGDPEVDAYFSALGWNPAKRTAARASYPDREKLIAHLKTLANKAGKTVSISTGVAESDDTERQIDRAAEYSQETEQEPPAKRTAAEAVPIEPDDKF